MEKASSAPRSRVARAPGDIALAALLVLYAFTDRARAPRAGWAAAVPVIGVNVVAFTGQLRYWGAYLADPFQQVLVAAVLESIAVYWAWQAHRARMANDSAFRPQLAAYLFAAGVGVLNYSHFCGPGWQPTVAAVTFGGMSVISPWLWASYSRRENRDELKARGDIEDHAVRLGATRWVWHAFRSFTVMWLATWDGVTRPAEAIALFEARRAGKREAREKKRAIVGPPAPDSPAGNASPSARPRGAAPGGTSQREARNTAAGLAAASPGEQAALDEARKEARREAGRRGAAIRWGRNPEAAPAGVNGNGSSSHG